MNSDSPSASPILRRILNGSRQTDFLSFLESLTPTDFQSVLLEVFRRRSGKQSPSELLKQYDEKYPFLGVSGLSQRELTAFAQLFFSVLPSYFQDVELSPVSPFGINGILAKLSQNNVLSGSKNMEVTGDPTVVLSLEAARQRKALLAADQRSDKKVHLCTCHRLLRLQPFDHSLGYMQHFRCFGMCTAGRDIGHEAFLIETLQDHLTVYLSLINILCDHEFQINEITVYLSDMRIVEKIIALNGVERRTVTRNAQNPDFNIFKECGVNAPDTVDDIQLLDLESFSGCDVSANCAVLNKLAEEVISPLKERYPEVHFGFKLNRTAGIGYYQNICFHIYGRNAKGLQLLLSDGGMTDWTQRLLQSSKELLMTSGFGAELVQKMFRVP